MTSALESAHEAATPTPQCKSISKALMYKKAQLWLKNRATRQHSKFILKKSIEIRNEHSVRLLRLHTA